MRHFFKIPAFWLAGTAMAMLAGAFAGCSYSHGPEPGPCNDPTPATYTAVVSPIFDAGCRRCHGTSTYQTRGGGTDLGTYQALKAVPTTLLMGCIEQQPGYDAMPKGAPRLSDCDIARIRAWIAAGQLNN
jgi:mono/diheme cytochrome c family protein